MLTYVNSPKDFVVPPYIPIPDLINPGYFRGDLTTIQPTPVVVPINFVEERGSQLKRRGIKTPKQQSREYQTAVTASIDHAFNAWQPGNNDLPFVSKPLAETKKELKPEYAPQLNSYLDVRVPEPIVLNSEEMAGGISEAPAMVQESAVALNDDGYNAYLQGLESYMDKEGTVIRNIDDYPAERLPGSFPKEIMEEPQKPIPSRERKPNGKAPKELKKLKTPYDRPVKKVKTPKKVKEPKPSMESKPSVAKPSVAKTKKRKPSAQIEPKGLRKSTPAVKVTKKTKNPKKVKEPKKVKVPKPEGPKKRKASTQLEPKGVATSSPAVVTKEPKVTKKRKPSTQIEPKGLRKSTPAVGQVVTKKRKASKQLERTVTKKVAAKK